MKALATLTIAVSTAAFGQVIDPFYAGSYTYSDLGAVPGLPPQAGGLTLLAGTNNTLLIGGNANTAGGAIYAVGVSRDSSGHINAFTGTATLHIEAPYNDGGIVYGPGGVLFASRWPVNELAQYRPGSTTPDRIIDLAALGVASSNAAIQFVPSTYSGAGRMKLGSWSGGQFYDATYEPDGAGTFTITSVTQTATLSGGPEGFAYVPTGSPLFGGPTLIVSEYTAGNVAVYDVDANGDPIESSRRNFITGLTGAEGAFIDPLTGDFIFSTFGGGNRVIVVQGFIPTPGTLTLACGAGLLALRRRR
ncbi:MAG: hypothetical protein HUU18_10415 [Phycisphaerales bacterium]|nr:hypothetical protein [Phycisphaerales bacterium]